MAIEPVMVGNATLFLADNLEVLPMLETQSIKVIVTDPPYGIAHPCNFRGRGRGKLAQCNDYSDVQGDNKPFDPSWLLALGLPLCLWGANWYADKLPPSGGWLVWDKMRPDTLDQATCELAWTNFVKGVRRYQYLWNGMIRDGEQKENYHPTQKPVALMRWILSLPWTPSGTVFDPYMGSGPVGIACAQLGRGFIGVEVEEKYFHIAVERIKKAYMQLKLNLDEEA